MCACAALQSVHELVVLLLRKISAVNIDSVCAEKVVPLGSTKKKMKLMVNFTC